MTQAERKQELIHSYKSQSLEDLSSYEYLQNLVIHLSAKSIIEERKKKLQNDRTIEDAFATTLGSLDFEQVIDEYMDAARQFMPAFYKQFSFDEILYEVQKLISDEDGLDKCYAVLKLKKYNANRKTVISFVSLHQTQFTYDKDGNEVATKFTQSNRLTFFQEGNKFELEVLNNTANAKQCISDLTFDVEAMGFICYKNSDVTVKLNREPFYNVLETIDVVNKLQKWLLRFAK